METKYIYIYTHTNILVTSVFLMPQHAAFQAHQAILQMEGGQLCSLVAFVDTYP